MCEIFFCSSTPCGDSHLRTSVVGATGTPYSQSQLHSSLPVWFIIKGSCIAVSDKGISQKKKKTFVDRSSPGPFIFASRFENLQILDLDSYPCQSPVPYFFAFLPRWPLGYSSTTPVFPLRRRGDGRIISVLQQDLGFQSYNNQNVVFHFSDVLYNPNGQFGVSSLNFIQ